jgi:citrate lyase subunit beta/citryl-CoA lyase
MTRRRACLVVPAAPTAKLEKGRTIEADEVVLDLEDAVVPAEKDRAREAVHAALARGEGGSAVPHAGGAAAAVTGGSAAPHTGGAAWAAESVAVRVNAIGTPWCHLDIAALAGVAATLVIPKIESAGDLAFADRLLDGAGGEATRILALIETPAGLQNVAEIAGASPRLDGLILGYADLAASLGRGQGEPGDWRFAQDAVLVAARTAGIHAIDGPYLGIRDDDAFRAQVAHARALGFDGKWAIHPAQLEALREAFTPTEEEVEDARETIAALERAAADGVGAIAAGDRMLDEALAVSARRTLARANIKGDRPLG